MAAIQLRMIAPDSEAFPAMNWPRRLVARSIAIAALASGLAPSSLPAQTPADAPAPYPAVALKLPEEHADGSFAAFRKELADVARTRIFAELARIVVTPGFFWERDFEGAFDPKRSAAENFAAAIGLERNNGAGWRSLAHYAAEAGADRMPSRPGVICAPPQPIFDAYDFSRLLESTQTARADWGYARAGSAEVRAAARERSAVVAKIGLHFVRILAVESKDGGPEAARTAWARVATPAGKTGFVAPGTLAPAYPPRLCYAKDAVGRWRIAGFIGVRD
jgi:hypothetical protein